MYDRISDFYDGKSIFLTGATGYLGSVLLEILLRCLPKIKHVYVLLRPKKGLEPQERKKIIFRKEIFNKLLTQSPGITDKVKVVIGDISQPHLGINEDDLFEIIQEVSIVIHCAALLTFTLPFRVSVKANALGTKKIVELCRKLKKCEVLVYTSTIYSNAHLQSETIEEKNYKLPFPIETVLTDLETKDDEWFSQFLSKYNCKFPNSYTFSKCLAENILTEESTDIPLVIIRPSIILGMLKGPNPGYVERGFGSIDLSLAIGAGLLSVITADEIQMHLIPADFVANTVITSAWLVVTNRFSSPFIVNCTCGDFWNISVPDYGVHIINFFSKNILPKCFREPTCIPVKNKYLYKVLRFYKDFLPCIVLDAVSHFKGYKLRLMPIQKKIENVVPVLTYFLSTPYTFSIEQFKNISKMLHPEDREAFYVDLTGTKFNDVLNNLSYNTMLYDWDNDKYSPKKRKHIVFANTMFTTFIKRFTLFMFISLIYFVISKIFL